MLLTLNMSEFIKQKKEFNSQQHIHPLVYVTIKIHFSNDSNSQQRIHHLVYVTLKLIFQMTAMSEKID